MLSEQTAASHFDIKQNKYVLTNPRRAAKQTSSCPKTSLTDMISRAFSTGKSALREQDGPIIISVFKVLFQIIHYFVFIVLNTMIILPLEVDFTGEQRVWSVLVKIELCTREKDS